MKLSGVRKSNKIWGQRDNNVQLTREGSRENNLHHSCYTDGNNNWVPGGSLGKL